MLLGLSLGFCISSSLRARSHFFSHGLSFVTTFLIGFVELQGCNSIEVIAAVLLSNYINRLLATK